MSELILGFNSEKLSQDEIKKWVREVVKRIL